MKKSGNRIAAAAVALVSALICGASICNWILEDSRTNRSAGVRAGIRVFSKLPLRNGDNGRDRIDAVAVARDGRHRCVAKIRSTQKFALSNVLGQDRFDRWGHRVLYVDPAYHDNVGDSMITRGTIQFLADYGWDERHLDQCNLKQARPTVPDCGDFRTFQGRGATLALWHGGGNWGNLYPGVQAVRIQSFEHLLKRGYTILGMPQSLHYDGPSDVKLPSAEDDAAALRASAARGLGFTNVEQLDTPEGQKLAQSRIILTWRERESFDAAKVLLPYVTNMLVPDAAFNLGPFLPSEQAQLLATMSTNTEGSAAGGLSIPEPIKVPEKVDILLFMRIDGETTYEGGKGNREQGWRSYFDSLPSGRGRDVTFRVVDWGDRASFTGDDYRFFSRTAVDLIASGSVVVADRLHASILAFLSDVPLVFVDQRTKKISRTLGVAFEAWEGCQDKDRLMYAGAETWEEGAAMAIDFLERYGLRKEAGLSSF